MMTGKLLGFTEEIKDIFEGTHNTSTSLSRAPGPPEAGVKGSTSSFPFWPGGMDEPWADLLKKESLDASLFEEELLDTPPGFKCGMKFERKTQDEVDYIHSQPQKIYLSEVLAMDDDTDWEVLNEPEEKEEIDLEKTQIQQQEKPLDEEDPFLKLSSLPVLSIGEAEKKKPATIYEWAVIEDVARPVEDFKEKIPKMALTWDFDLDPFQQRAVVHLEKKESVFVAAHTSAGKTVVAEYAIALARNHVTRVIYTSPIKALSNQKYRDFKEKFGDVGLITGDVQINPTAFCLIMTTEILRSMLYHGSDVVRELEWVIFDEVHYINDSERGVVWEEVFIMLPDHVNLIMLSATVPNTAEFAEWLGGIKKRKIYVISTLKRPVPLMHYLYTGSVGKTENDIFPIVDSSGKFLSEEYMKATKPKDNKSKTATGPKGPKYNLGFAQEKNIYIGLLGYLQKKDLLPTVCFTLSRKKCNTHAEMLSSRDLTTQVEKREITKFFNECISKLKSEDRKLPQVRLMGEQLKLGFGVHHSGILPILKEVVEMLFQRSLLKVLFATETFAMGVNMPTRTVVFDSIRKHDGLNFRDLKPSEYIQMAGRAGRRGKDKIGTVIILCKAEVPDSLSLHNMMLGKPTKLESQFKLTYSMILNLLKIKTFRVEDVIKRSFGESGNQKQQKMYKDMLTEATKKLANLTKLDCSLCNIDLAQYIIALKEARILRNEVMDKKCSLAIASKMLTPGRILVISINEHLNVLCTLLSIDNKDNKLKVLAIAEKNKSLVSKNSTSDPNILPWTKQLFYPSERQPELLNVTFCDIQVIGNKVLRIDDSAILKESKRLHTMSSNPGYSTSSAFQELCSLCEANLNGFPSANINLKDINFVSKVHDLERLEKSFGNYTCVKCPEFAKHFGELNTFLQTEEDIREYSYKLSEESLSLHPDYESRKAVLKKLGYIDENENVQLKGCVAREMSNHELLITELLMTSVFTDCPPEEVAALLSCMVFQQKNDDANLELPSHLLQKIQDIRQVAMDISVVQSENQIMDPNFVSQYNFYLVPVVYEWAKGTIFAEIMKKTDIDEGIIVRSIQRLSELLKDVRNGANLVGDTVLAKKMEDASHQIKRDIVFAASLYTQ
ncbi:helicase SKI2W [Trichonephila clavata]|uniref:Helicase SKI2W n=1 Tax=Trichonephila clavata TaxID=2740835 RepID=A0A8X6HNM7_TRICU|nr:helicase SKI2W [Trichonephila clavata]